MSNTTPAQADDDAVIAWLYKSDSHILILDRWINLSEKNKQRHRDKYAAHIREQHTAPGET